MKTTKTVTREETIITCDHCGGVVRFSGSQCIVCGKHACENCFSNKLVILELPSPVWDSRLSVMPYFERVEACPGCKSDITIQFAAAKKLIEAHNKECSKFRGNLWKIAEPLKKAIEKRQHQLESD